MWLIGIISCFDFSPDYSGLYAAGSYSQNIGLYEEKNNKLCLKLSGIQGGVTQVNGSKCRAMVINIVILSCRSNFRRTGTCSFQSPVSQILYCAGIFGILRISFMNCRGLEKRING